MSPHPLPQSRSSALPRSTWIQLGLVWSVVIAFQFGAASWLAEPIGAGAALACFAVLFATILHAAFGVVREADHLADRLGEPYGTLILTLSIVSIEVILIAAVMLGPGDTPTIGRDSIFAVMMIILNLVMGLCLVAGGLRHGEQTYNVQGATAYLSMIVLLTSTALVLPRVTSAGNASFLPIQALAVATLTLALYAAFLALQMGRYRRFFIQPPAGRMMTPPSGLDAAADEGGAGEGGVGEGGAGERAAAEKAASDGAATNGAADGRADVIGRALVLVGLMLPIIVLAHHLAILIDFGIALAGAPVAVGGVLIAIIVFTPESITAIRAARANETQRAINLCLGAFVSTVGLTVPAVLAIGLVTGQAVTLGLGDADLVLLAITMALTALTFLGAPATPIQGLMHLMLFMTYAVLLFAP